MIYFKAFIIFIISASLFIWFADFAHQRELKAMEERYQDSIRLINISHSQQMDKINEDATEALEYYRFQLDECSKKYDSQDPD